MTDESDDTKPARDPDPGRALRLAPGWVTSVGAFCSLVFGGFNYSNHQDAQRDEAKLRQEAETRLADSQRRIWDAINKDREATIQDRKDDAAAREHLRERTHDEILAEIAREFDRGACAPPRGACRDR